MMTCMLPPNEKVPGSNPGDSGFLPQSKEMQIEDF